MLKTIVILAVACSFLFSKELTEVLSKPEYKKAYMVIQQDDKNKDKNQMVGKLTLEVKGGSGEMLEILAVDPVTKKEQIIPVYDNGLNGDEVAGDGFYSGTTFITPGKVQKFYLSTQQSKYDNQVLFEYVLFKW